MSDSDSDDSLLDGGPVFSRKAARQERAADKKRASGLAFLESSMQEENKRRALNDAFLKIKQENLDCDEERLTQAENIAKESKEKRKASTEQGQEKGLAALALRDQLATALDTAQANTLGTRTVLGRGNDKDTWSTVDFCLEELDAILKRLQEEKGGQKDEKAFRSAVVSLLKAAIKADSLEQVLTHRKLAKLCQRYNRTYLPRELTEWLFCLASNPVNDEDSSELSTGAFQTLETIFSRAQGTTPGVPLFTMQDMIRDMQAWFALRLPSVDDAKQNEEGAVVTSRLPVSTKGLGQFLLLWEQALRNDIVALGESPKETATQCMIALSRAALDPCFYKDWLLTALQRVIGAFLAFVARNVASDQDELKDWIAVTVPAILNQCKTLKAESSSVSKHHDDDEMWLCLALITRVISSFDTCNDTVDDIHRQVRASIAIQALQQCLEIDDWDEQIQTVLSERGETELPVRASSSLAWRAIASSYAGFLTIPSLGSAITKNGQRCLATVNIITYCILAGVTFHSSPIDMSSEDEAIKGVFGTKQEASLLLRVMEALETEGRQLASRVSAFSSDPNFSRAEYLLSCLRRYGDHVRLKARSCSGQAGSPVSVQKSIQNYFGDSPES